MMKKRSIAVTVLAVALGAGAAVGCGWRAHLSAAPAPAGAKPAAAVYTCPMHPDYHSDHPGTCPVCGMTLERLQAAAKKMGAATPPAEVIRISVAQQHAIGVQVGVVSRVSGTRLVRTTGRVVAEENRTYPIVAALSGWIRDVGPVTTGDTVTKEQVLGSFYVTDPQYEMAQQAYFSSLEMMYRVGGTQPQSHESGRALELLERVADGLRNLGVSNSQMREMAKRRDVVHDIRLESSVDGVVLKRNVTPGVRFDRGFEFYQIADLSRVWILADVDGRQLPFIRRGAAARVTAADQGRPFSATVSASQATFDEAAQTLKVRLEAANPRSMLKPGMFVDVEVPVDLPAALVVPADAIVDSGLRKTVFVECGSGEFEARLIETGWRSGGEVAVTKGLTAGERIVISGTFFVDSERRMKGTP